MVPGLPVMRRTSLVSVPMLTLGALIRASTPGTSPSPADARLLTSASIPAMPSVALPPSMRSRAPEPPSRYWRPGCSRSRAARALDATKWPRSSAVHSRWSEAVASGVQERNCPGSTPSTFTRPAPSRIEAPSADTRPRTPGIRDSLARCAVVSPDGTITSRSGRTM